MMKLAIVWGRHRLQLNSLPKVQWRAALMFSLTCAWINGWVNNREAVNLKRHRAHYDVTKCNIIHAIWCQKSVLFVVNNWLALPVFLLECSRQLLIDCMVADALVRCANGLSTAMLLYPLTPHPRFNEVEKGILVSPCPSVRLSVCASSTILVGSISCLHILSCNFRRCVACNVCFFSKFNNLKFGQII